LCAVFDGLVFKRPYKSPIFLVPEQGACFDPVLAKRLVQFFSNFEDIYDQFRDPAYDDDDQQ